MAIAITPEIQTGLDNFVKSLHTVDNLKQAFCNAPPSVDAEPYQYLFEDAVTKLMHNFDALCALLGLPN